ncbi:MAG: ABC transporter ATP-binding protein [Ignavibacteriae bacterium]|nr:ABC transporter ATP-binding protein [Ignavibacteria bacterium]MBI3363504.1 ABC transporter ATP-binding protein [Ignavibacteriota bacterium]
MSLLELRNVSVKRVIDQNARFLNKGVSLSVDRGEVVAIVGESGSGKTTLLRSIPQLLPFNAGMVTEGSIEFQGENILRMSQKRLQMLRQNTVRSIFQEPGIVFNPVSRISTQVGILIASFGNSGKQEFSDCLIELGMDKPDEVLRSYPHQMSVGMLQRISIALAVASHPALILADEPTSAIDAIHRSRALRLLANHSKIFGAALLLTTHDLCVARKYADVVIVMYGGRVIERSSSKEFFLRPRHPYSKILLANEHFDPGARRNLHFPSTIAETFAEGEVKMKGCDYWKRCSIAHDSCSENEPELLPVDENHEVRCPFSK